jgi:hypothetical protein
MIGPSFVNDLPAIDRRRSESPSDVIFGKHELAEKKEKMRDVLEMWRCLGQGSATFSELLTFIQIHSTTPSPSRHVT